MAPILSSDSEAGLSSSDRHTLLELARSSIESALAGEDLTIDEQRYSQQLRRMGACFVTLRTNGQLRGCIGSIEAYRSLVEDVIQNARAAAFHDPRFPPLTWSEFADLEIHISRLHPPSPLSVANEQELLAQIRPGVDGLILEQDGHRGTFLPAVWDSLPKPEDFVRELKRKAGLPVDRWLPGTRVSRYTVEEFP